MLNFKNNNGKIIMTEQDNGDLIIHEENLLGFTEAEELTNFPKQGDNKKISLSNSNFKLFPFSYAQNLKETHPEIWRLGGNIQGNDTYAVLSRIISGDISADKLTPGQKDIIKMREAWCARHYEDKNIAGVVAQVKWLLVGSRGLSYMKNLIQEEISKREKRK